MNKPLLLTLNALYFFSYPYNLNTNTDSISSIIQQANNLAYNYPDGTIDTTVEDLYKSNLLQANNLFKKAHELGHKDAIYDITAIKIILTSEKFCDDIVINKEDLDILEKALSINSKNSNYWLALAHYFLTNNDTQKAKNALEKSAKLKNKRALFLLGIMLLDRNGLFSQDINLACKYLNQLLLLTKKRSYEKKTIFLCLKHIYSEDENCKENKTFRYLLGKVYQIFQELIIQKKFKWEEDPDLYNKVIDLKQILEQELVIGAL